MLGRSTEAATVGSLIGPIPGPGSSGANCGDVPVGVEVRGGPLWGRDWGVEMGTMPGGGGGCGDVDGNVAVVASLTSLAAITQLMRTGFSGSVSDVFTELLLTFLSDGPFELA